jgi:hypothetical protein
LYRILSGAMNAMSGAMLEAVWSAREMVDRGLVLMSDRPASARDGLLELRNVYRFFESSVPALLESWETAQREGTA